MLIRTNLPAQIICAVTRMHPLSFLFSDDTQRPADHDRESAGRTSHGRTRDYSRDSRCDGGRDKRRSYHWRGRSVDGIRAQTTACRRSHWWHGNCRRLVSVMFCNAQPDAPFLYPKKYAVFNGITLENKHRGGGNGWCPVQYEKVYCTL